MMIVRRRARRRGVLALTVTAYALSSACRAHDAPPDPPEVAAQRELRQRSAAEIAPRPLPVAAPSPDAVTTAAGAAPAALVPLRGAEGNDADGWPRQHVDRAALRALLRRGGYAELTRAVERLQDAFEEDPAREAWPADAADALGTAEKELLPSLDAWVLAAPGSFAPYLARGTHWVNAAYARRGGAWAEDTAASDFAAMDEALGRALPDLRRALELRPGLVAAMNALLRAHKLMPGGRKANAVVIDEALRRCPSCFLVDVTFLNSLLPRWGGSYALMRAHVQRRLRKAPGPRSALLAGLIDLDRADAAHRERRNREALALVQRACRRGEHWSFLVRRADVELAMGDTARALADLDRAAQLRPGHPDVLYDRAWALTVARRWEDAGRDLRAGLEVDPAHWMVRGGASKLVANVVAGLMVAGWERARTGDREGAIRDYDLAVELDPGNHEAQGRRAAIIAGGKAEPGALTRELEQAQRDVPDDFGAVQKLDYQLAREGRFGPVVGLWTRFLEKHPAHGQAYLERGGAYFHLGRRDEALADARRACDLGVSEGCVRARQLAPTR